MRLLLDTQTFLWFIGGSPELSSTARSLIEGPDEKLVSMVSLWEMTIKLSLGKLILDEPFETLIPEQLRINGFGVLNIDFEHVVQVSSLPFHHRDPFDRLLVAQCLVEGMPIVSRDVAFDAYAIQRFW